VGDDFKDGELYEIISSENVIINQDMKYGKMY
jgi:hypothetical protein